MNGLAVISENVVKDLASVISNGTDGTSHQIDSVLYKWNGSNFASDQNIATKGVHDIAHFEVDGDHYLAIANHWDDSSRNIDSQIKIWNFLIGGYG